jgi:hypothetical protein
LHATYISKVTKIKEYFVFLQKIYSEYELQGLEEDKLQCGQYQVHTERKRYGGQVVTSAYVAQK